MSAQQRDLPPRSVARPPAPAAPAGEASVHVVRSEAEWDALRAEEEAERRVLLALPPQEAQALADVLFAGSGLWDVEWNHDALRAAPPGAP